ncbi:MAG: shikimate kinase [Chloroflexota bacterium]
MVTTTRLQLTDSNLILTGYIEPNKPRIGRQIANQLKMRFIDVEERIENRMGSSIEELRDTFGQRHLKMVEDELMEEMILYRNSVLRINGSILANSEYLERLQSTGTIICLVARLDAILKKMHLTLGARYHDPAERGVELGKLRREWAIRKHEGIHELDATDASESDLIIQIVDMWQTLSIERV